MPSLQQASCVWINLPGWLLIWRWVARHPTTPKLISLCHCITPTPTITTDTHTCTHIAKYLHLSLSHLHGRGQEGGWLVRRRKVSALKEFIILRCQSRSLGEQMKGRGRRRGWEGGSNSERERGGGLVSYLSRYWLSAKSSSRPAELAGFHFLRINLHTVHVSPSRVVFDCILIMRKPHTLKHIILKLWMVIWWLKTQQRVYWNTRSWLSNTHTHTLSLFPKWSYNTSTALAGVWHEVNSF